MIPAFLLLSFATLFSAAGTEGGTYEHAIAAARASVARSAPEQAAAATESLADILSRHAIEHQDAAAADEARRLYETLLATTATAETLHQRVLNSYGVFLLESGDVASAMRVFGELDERQVRESRNRLPDHARYFFNAGEAALRDGTRDLALRRYTVSLLADPTFTDSCDRAVEIVKDTPEAISPDDISALIRRSNFTCSEQLLRAAVGTEAWRPGSERFDVALRLIAQLWTASAASPQQVQGWRSLLETGQSCAACAKKVTQLTALVDPAPLPVAYDENEVEHLASEWRRSEEDRRAFSRLAITAGHVASFETRNRDALSRYMVAWRVDPSNFDAPTYVAGVLISAGEREAKSVVPELGNALAISKIEVATTEQRRQLMRLHTIVGDLHARRLGALDRDDGPIHWWTKAAHDYELLSDGGHEKGEGAQLYERLAHAYDLLRQPLPARQYNLGRAKACIEAENWPDAEDALTKALKHDEQISAEMMLEIERLRLAIVLGDLGLQQKNANVHPRVAMRELYTAVRKNAAEITVAASRAGSEARRNAAKRDVLITGDVERRLVTLGKSSGATVVLAVQRTVYLFGPILAEEFARTYDAVQRVDGVQRVVTRGASTKPRDVKSWLALQSRRKKKVMTGAVVGALIGAASAAATGDDMSKRAIAGAVTGALFGLAMATRPDRIFAPRNEAARLIAYDSSHGYVTRVTVLSVDPPHASPGQSVSVFVRYLVIGPDPSEPIRLRIFRGLLYGADYLLGTGPHEVIVPKGGGIVESVIELTLPANAPAGTYTLEALIEEVGGRVLPAIGRAVVQFGR